MAALAWTPLQTGPAYYPWENNSALLLPGTHGLQFWLSVLTFRQLLKLSVHVHHHNDYVPAAFRLSNTRLLIEKACHATLTHAAVHLCHGM